MALWRRARHRVAHWLGWNEGHGEVRWLGDTLLAGFRCTGCGEMSHVHEVDDSKWQSHR